ncbi:MAG: cytochrome C [Ignavibacteriales bacterium]
MKTYRQFVLLPAFAAVFIALFIDSLITYAIPSFARQTNLPCNTCHSIFPELTVFGRQFKRMGYSLVGVSSIQATSDSETVIMRLPNSPPVSGMIMASFSHENKEQPGAQNGNFSFPQQLSLFLAGSLTPKIGGFFQITYDQQSGTIGMDNADLRYADQTELFSEGFVYGIDINNNPTVQDLWNSLPAWRFPFAASATSPAPAAATLIEGGLAQKVIGLGIYSLWNDLLYAEVTLYKTAIQGGHNPPDSSSNGVLKSVAPYWRVALQRQISDNYVEVGTFGMAANQFAAGVTGLTNKYTDIGFDLNFEKPLGGNILTVHGSYIHETLSPDSALSASTALNSFNINGNIILHSQIGFSLGYFSITGDNNPALNAPVSVSGSASGSPNSSGLAFEFDYLPWLNTKLALQYIAYNKFNGGTSNYDGSGRNASDNNTLYLLTWVAF